MKKLMLTGCILALALGAYAVEGVKIASKTTNLTTKSISSTNIYLTSKNVVVENEGSGDNFTIILNADREELTYVDHDKREYYFFDKPAIIQLRERLRMMKVMLESFGANLPEAQRKELKKKINSASDPVQFTATGVSERVGKWKTKAYQGKSNGEKTVDIYIASFKTVGISKDKFQVMEKMIAYFKAYLSDAEGFLPKYGTFSQIGLDENSPAFKEGIPVKTISYANNRASSETLVQSVAETEVSNSLFQVPAGYTRKQLDMKF